MKRLPVVLCTMLFLGLGLRLPCEMEKIAGPLVPDANTILLDHFDGGTSASILAFSENEASCGSAKPAATPVYSYASGLYGLGQTLLLSPPAGAPAGSGSYLVYPGGQLLSQANGTIEFWLYLTAYGANGLSLVDQGQYYTACFGWTFQMGINPTGMLYSSAWNAFSMTSGTTVMPLNAWTHVAATWGSAGAKLYVNGVQVGSDTNTGMPASGYSGQVMMLLGTTAGGTSRIDELRISNIQRTYTDAAPEPFAFTDQTDVALSTVTTSNAIAVDGIDTAAPISISGGTYAINGGSYTSAGGSVIYGDTVTVRQTSSSSNSTTTDATLTIGGVSDTFSVTTLPAAGPSITVTSPNGGETWVMGSTQSITWTWTGSIANVVIETSLNNGVDWIPIQSVANTGSYSTFITYVYTRQCLIRVSDAADAGVFDVSDAVFSIFSDGSEPNDDPGSAALLPIGTTGNLVFDGGDNTNPEWFKFFVPAESAGQDLRVNVRVTSPYPDPIPYPEWASDLDFELLDGSLRVLGCAISRSDNETIYLHNVASGWYYINVGYCTIEYADASDHAEYAITLETGTGFGIGYITGRLLDGGGSPVANEFIFLDPLSPDWNISRPYMTSGTDGTFAVAFLPGSYTLLFNNAGKYISANFTYPSPNVVAEYYSDKKTAATADQLTFAAGQTLSLGDISLETGAIVTGHVINLAAANLASVQVRAYDGGGNSYSYELAYTDAAGNYSLNSVPAGARIRFSRSGYATEFYDDQPTLGAADVQPTVPGGTLNDNDAVLGAGGTISGTVSDSLGAGIGGVRVVLYSALDATYSRAGMLSESGTGAFSFIRLLPGDYKIYFDTTGLAYIPEWYDNADSFAAAATVSVSEGGTTSGISAQLAPYTITVTSPNGGESWIATTSHDITWTSTGTIANVNIEYTTDGGTNWTGVAVSTPNDGSYSWTIPDTPSGNCILCISDSANPPLADYSDTPFTIAASSTPSLTLTSPNGGENWTAGSMVDVDWTSTGSIALVNIDYSIDGGSNWLPILAGTTNDGHSGDWVLPNITSTTCLVRVSDAANAAMYDVSDAFFSITIREDDIYEDNDTPAAAAEMAPGTYYGLILRDEDYFKVYVEAGKDLVVRTMGSAISPTDGSDMDIELYSASGGLLIASSGDSTNETLCLSNLAAGWYVIRNVWYGTPHYYALDIWSGDLPLGEISGRVTDVHGSPIAHVWVMFYDLSGSWSLLRGYVPTDANGDYRFAYIAGDHKLLFECSYPAVDDSIRGKYINEWYNDTDFAGAQTLTTTAGGALTGIDAVLGDAGWITGMVTGPEGQPLYAAYAQAYDSGGIRISSTYSLGDGTYRLGGIAASGEYRIRFRPPGGTPYAVEWYNDKNWSGAADAVSVTVGSETPGINAQFGYGGTISGQVTAAVGGLPIANVTVVAYDENNIVISSSVSDASGLYTIYWVPACNVKLFFNTGTTGYAAEWYNDKASFETANLVPVAAGQNVTDINAQLSLPIITVTSPNGGETWFIGSTQNITWTSTASVGSVDIIYTYDGGANWTSIVADTANDSSHLWIVPDTPSGNCFVQVLEHADGVPWDSSDTAFSIAAQPASVTVSGTILYNSSPLAGVVMNGLPGNPATNGSGFYTSAVDYDWSGTVTPTLAGYAFTPASRSYANITSDQTSQNYTAALAPALQLTSPNGWEHWTLGSTKAITWNAINYTGTVRLVLFKGGVRFGNIAANIPAAAGSYSWTVGQTYDSGMAPEGSDYRLYLRSTDGTLIDPSDTRLGLINPAQLELTAPNGGESWELGTTQNITWNANGYAGTVRLILFQKGIKIGQIAANLPAAQGSYSWTVGTHQNGTATAGVYYSIRLLAGDGSQDDFSDGPMTLVDNDALIVDHHHTAMDAIPGEWLEQARRHKLLVLGAPGNDPVALGLRLLGSRDAMLATAQTPDDMGLMVNEGSWLPQGAALDPQEWRWALEKAILDSQATVAVIRPDEQALLTGKLNAENYLATLAELSARLPGVKLVCSTVSLDEPNDILARFNRQLRESVLRNKGVLFDAADIESWSGNEQTLVNEVPVKHPAHRMIQGMQSQGNLASHGTATWWLLARLAGWPGPQPEMAE